jgi:hypothetical protein
MSGNPADMATGASVIPKKLAPDLIRCGYRFSDKNVRK